MQTFHVASHDLGLLEAFVHDGVQQLPKLSAGSSHAHATHELPARGATYHAACSAMLRQVLGVLDPLSPRVCRLLAQIWELASLNVFVLLQLAQTALAERDALRTKWLHVERFYDEAVTQYAARVQRYETEAESVRVDARELRAELQKTRQKHNRLAVENAQLRKAVRGLMETADAHDTSRSDGSSIGGGDGSSHSLAVDSSLVGDAEERELFGVNADELDAVETVHPVESCAQDLDELLQSLSDKEREQMALLNEMDRFMNSNVVALLWRHGPDESESKFLQQMLTKRTVGSQTEDHELALFADDDEEESERAAELGEGESRRLRHSSIVRNADAHDDGSASTGDAGNATVVTKRQVIPASLRAQLTTRPKIQRVLERDHLARVLLRVLLEKMELDGASLRRRQPRVTLHRFLKDFFVARYGIAPLAEYHMMEVVKSCLYYHEKQEADARALRLITGGVSPAQPPGASTFSSDDSANAAVVGFSLLPGIELTALSPDDARAALFARLCELVPLQCAATPLPPVAGNLFASATNAVLDLLGDVVELDQEVATLHHVVLRGSAHEPWEIPVELGTVLLAHHLAFLDSRRLELAKTRLLTMASACSSSFSSTRTTGSSSGITSRSDGRSSTSNCGAGMMASASPFPVTSTDRSTAGPPAIQLSVDFLLVFFAGHWLDHDRRLTAKLHEVFHAQLHAVASCASAQHHAHAHSSASVAAAAVQAIVNAQSMELLRRMWTSLPDESLSPMDLDDLESTFRSVLEHRAPQQQLDSRRRSSAKRQSVVGVAHSTSVSGISGAGSLSPSLVPTLHVAGITAKEFVFQTQQVLRARRTCRGMRTNGRSVFEARTGQHLGGGGRVLEVEAVQLPSDELKPGFES